MADTTAPRRITSAATSITVAPPPPYQVPSQAGTSMAIVRSGEATGDGGFPVDVMPSYHTAARWDYALFRAYGGGGFVPQYSAHGAWVTAGCGGHGAGPLFGAAAFDFSTGKWVGHPTSTGEPQTSDDIPDTNISTNWGEILQSAYPNIGPYLPTPAHIESGNIAMPGGTGKGAILRVLGYAGGASSMRGSNGCHMFDLNTNTWSRRSTNTIGTWGDFTALYDATSNKIYRPNNNPSSHPNGMTYLDCSDWTFKAQSVGSIGTSHSCRSGFIDPMHRLMVLVDSGLAQLIAFQMDANGVQNLAPVLLNKTADSVTPIESGLGVKGKWAYCPADGCHYMMFGWGADNFLYRILPPSSSPPTNPWWITRHSITPVDGRPLPSQSTSILTSNSQHCSRFFWNPGLGCFAWIPGNGDAGSRSNGQRVYLIRPPAVV